MMLKTIRIGTRQVPVKLIQVQVLPNDQDWQFTFVDAGNGKKQMAVF